MEMINLEWFKRHAKKIKKEKNVKLYEALDLASQEQGYKNYQHLRNQNPESVSQEFYRKTKGTK